MAKRKKNRGKGMGVPPVVGRLVARLSRMVSLIWNRIHCKMWTQPWKGYARQEVPDVHPTQCSEGWCWWKCAWQSPAAVHPVRPEGGLAVPPEAQLRALACSDSVAFHFFSEFISLMQSICICWFCHLSDVSDLFVLNYITGWNVIVVKVFLCCWE